MGFTVSTLRTRVTPRRSLSGSLTYWGVSRKTGSITSAASAMRSTEIDASNQKGYVAPPAWVSAIPHPPGSLRERGDLPTAWGGEFRLLLRRRPGGSQGGAYRLRRAGCGVPALYSIKRLSPVKGYVGTCKNPMM